MAPAGSQGQLHSFDVNGLWKPMQSILAHMLISCQGVPDAISIPFYFFWTSLVQKQYILWKNEWVKKQSLTNFLVVICLLFTILILIMCLMIYTAPLYTKTKNKWLMLSG